MFCHRRRGTGSRHEGRLEIETHRKQTPAQCAVELGIHPDAAQPGDIGGETIGLDPRALGVNKGQRIGLSQPNNRPPFKIAPHQLFAVVIERKAAKFLEREHDDSFGRIARGGEMVEQRDLPALERLDEECLTQIVKGAVSSAPKASWNERPLARPSLILSAYMCSPKTR